MIVVPTNNYGTLQLDPSLVSRLSVHKYRGLPWVHTASLGSGACFYANNIAPLPFAIGSALPDTYVTWKVDKTFHYRKADTKGQGPGGAAPPTVNPESATRRPPRPPSGKPRVRTACARPKSWRPTLRERIRLGEDMASASGTRGSIAGPSHWERRETPGPLSPRRS